MARDIVLSEVARNVRPGVERLPLGLAKVCAPACSDVEEDKGRLLHLQSMSVQTPRLPITVGMIPGEFCWPMHWAPRSRSSRCDVHEQHSLSTSGFVAFWA